jgi:hypothetical protein
MALGAVHSRVDEAAGRFATIDVRGAEVLWAKIVRAGPAPPKDKMFDYAPIADALAPGEHLVADAKKQLFVVKEPAVRGPADGGDADLDAQSRLLLSELEAKSR